MLNLNQVTVPALDIEASIKFYQKLGLILIVKAPHYARFECPAGDATFSISKTDTMPTGKGIHVYFEIKELDIYVAKLQSEGILFLSLPNDKSWLWREAHLEDPSGNYLILYHAGSNRKNPPWRIGN